MYEVKEKERIYKEILESYINENDEQSLYLGQQLSRQMIEEGVSPEELVHLHVKVLMELYPKLDEEMKNSFEFLLEMMMDYGIAYREHQSLKNKQQQLNMEIELAASMQNTFLSGDVPCDKSLDIGAISQPAKKLNGDYYHFVRDENNRISVAIADVIGKGIPATLCMSMIKYAMESLTEEFKKPGAILENLNRVVERNVDDSMFITMFYGLYDPNEHRFYYASAGHEPGFIYHKKKDEFVEFSTKGIVLGVEKESVYPDYEVAIDPGDMIVLLSDGVTECRSKDGFIERHEIINLIRKYQHLPSQQIVEEVYRELEQMQNFELKDDVTLIILRRKV
ncbi:phosphoserine phosphatase [Pueribacillus theae]|uniref:Phosphoserine phosphatase n=1 Tax=Pueribacillus theae TaxID=2171751 RepID=A0A2U1JP77_9BACI|nr:PP2C family protein-serine/threonine phosphatase [Pueribacillus theae]PWA06981.1 phosphoserine phosphatase [Pueribacillus theae]